jgi:DNA replication protein DnaC
MCPSYVAMHGYAGDGGRVGAAGLPSEYRNITANNSPARSGQADVYAFVDVYVDTFKTGDRVKSVYLYSEEPGTGKTTTAAALLNEYLTAHYIGCLQRGETPLERPAFFLDVNEWQRDFNAFNRPRVPDETAQPAASRYYRTMGIAESVPFLVADDIGVRDASEAFRADLHSVINKRVVSGLPTVYTSNIPMVEMLRLFDVRIADRIRDMCGEIQFVGKSKRGRR